MTTSFPSSLDAFTNPDATTDDLDTPGVLHDEQHENANDAIEALEAKVGIDGSAVTTSIDYILGDHIDNHPGGAGAAVNGQVIRKTATESVTSSAVSQNDDHLLFAVAANEVWEFEFVLWYDAHADGDIRVQVAGPAGSTLSYTVLAANAGETALDHSSFIQRAGATDSGHGGSATIRSMLVKGVIVNGATAGNCQLKWAQLSSHATATRVFENSYVKARLFGNSGVSTAWTSYTPTWRHDGATQPTLGNGTLLAAARVDGKTLFLRFELTFGSTTNVGTANQAWRFTLPAGVNAKSGFWQISHAFYYDSSVGRHISGTAEFGNLVSMNEFRIAQTTQDAGGFEWNSSTPVAWGAGDKMIVNAVIEIA